MKQEVREHHRDVETNDKDPFKLVARHFNLTLTLTLTHQELTGLQEKNIFYRITFFLGWGEGRWLVVRNSTQKTNRKKRMKKGNPIKVTMRQCKNTYGERRMERVTYKAKISFINRIFFLRRLGELVENIYCSCLYVLTTEK